MGKTQLVVHTATRSSRSARRWFSLACPVPIPAMTSNGYTGTVMLTRTPYPCGFLDGEGEAMAGEGAGQARVGTYGCACTCTSV